MLTYQANAAFGGFLGGEVTEVCVCQYGCLQYGQLMRLLPVFGCTLPSLVVSYLTCSISNLVMNPDHCR